MLEEVKGQNEGVQFLQRVVDRQLNLPLLLVGPSGTGRRFSVISAAKEVVKEDASQVYQVACGRHPDVTVVIPEMGKEIKVDAIRELLEKAKFQPSRAPLRFLVIDGIDNITVAAANALLKVVEEAPESVRFFLLAEREKKVIPTLRSRCAIVQYKRLPEDFILEKLQDHTENMTKAKVCVRLAEGSVGKAIHYLNSGKLALRDEVLRLISLASRRDTKTAFSVVDSLADDLPLVFHFAEHILFDLTILPFSPNLVSNSDKVETLAKLRSELGPSRIEEVRASLKKLQASVGRSLNLSFHFKTLLASTF